MSQKKPLSALADEVVGRFVDAALVNPPLRLVWKEAREGVEAAFRVVRLYVRRSFKFMS